MRIKERRDPTKVAAYVAEALHDIHYASLAEPGGQGLGSFATKLIIERAWGQRLTDRQLRTKLEKFQAYGWLEKRGSTRCAGYVVTAHALKAIGLGREAQRQNCKMPQWKRKFRQNHAARKARLRTNLNYQVPVLFERRFPKGGTIEDLRRLVEQVKRKNGEDSEVTREHARKLAWRLVKEGELERVSRGIYRVPRPARPFAAQSG